MAKRLDGRVAVVTGAGGRHGMGKEIALGLAVEGAKVVVNDIAKDAEGIRGADRVVQEIRNGGGIAIANYDSVTSMAGGENIVNTAITNFGRIDILVNTAGNFRSLPTLEMTEADWDSMISVHLKGLFACTKAALPYMVNQKSGRMVNFTSRGGFFGGSNLAYAAAKAGVVGFTTKVAKEFKSYNITVNSISPSAMTELFPTKKKPMEDNIPLASPPDPAYVAPIVVFLATDEARDITGRTIYAAGKDICMHAFPFKLGSTHTFIRKPGAGRWTIDELSEVIPTIAQIG